MSLDRAALGKKGSLTEFERQYLLDRNILDHPGLGEESGTSFLDTGYQDPALVGLENQGDDEVETWDNLTVAELKDEASARSLATSGTKAELIARIEEYDANNQPSGGE